MPLPSTPPAHLGRPVSARDVIAAAVEWIHRDPFVREYRSKGTVKAAPGAPIGAGWDFRLKEYALAKRRTRGFPGVYSTVIPVLSRMAAIIGAYDWSSVSGTSGLSPADEAQLRSDAEWICATWGGVPQESYSETWKVVRSAVTGQAYDGAPMNSGWTKVASFASHGAANAQTIWDSRVATAVLMRLDGVLHANRLPSSLLSSYSLGHGSGSGSGSGSGLRAQKLALLQNKWPNGYGQWPYHFGGSGLVREMVAILNDPGQGYPAMPTPSGSTTSWDVFGVGLVLFMDGY